MYLLRDALFGQAFFERDLLWLYFSEIEAVIRALAAGSLPLRDPTIGFGQPLLASPDTQVLYPIAWLHLLFPVDRAYTFMVLAHLVIGAAGAAALSQRMSGRMSTAFLAGAFWMVCGPFQSALNLWHHFAGTAWLPWVLVAFDRVLDVPNRSRMLVLAAVFGVQILAGSADLCAATALLALLRWLCEGRNATIAFGKRSGMVAAALAIAISLGAGVWLSALELVGSGERSRLSREARTEWSVHPVALLELALPMQLGSVPWNAQTMSVLSDGRPPFIKSVFLGPLIVPLMLTGLLNSRISRAHRIFLALGTVTLAFVALGRHTPFYDVLVSLVPPLELFRFPIKAMLPLSLLASVLASVGVESIASARSRAIAVSVCLIVLVGNVVLLFEAGAFFAPFLQPSASSLSSIALARLADGALWCAALLACLAIAIASGRTVAIRGAAFLAVVACIGINRDINFTVSQQALRFRPPLVDRLKSADAGRLYMFSYLGTPELLPEVLDPTSPMSPEQFVILARAALMAPIGGVWNIEYAWDYDQKGLMERAISELTQVAQKVRSRPQLLLRMLQLANVTRAADFHPMNVPGLVEESTAPLPGGHALHIYRVADSLPRAYAVSGVRRLDVPHAQAAILDSAFDPRSEVVLTNGVDTPISPTFRSQVTIAERRSDRVVLDVTLSEPGCVVLLEGFMPGWRAQIDGADVEVRRANALFLGALASAGQHRVVFTYRPTGALAGLGVTAVTAVALLAALLHARSKQAVWTAPETLRPRI